PRNLSVSSTNLRSCMGPRTPGKWQLASDYTQEASGSEGAAKLPLLSKLGPAVRAELTERRKDRGTAARAASEHPRAVVRAEVLPHRRGRSAQAARADVVRDGRWFLPRRRTLHGPIRVVLAEWHAACS